MNASNRILGLALIGGLCACGANTSGTAGDGQDGVSDPTAAQADPMKRKHHHHKHHRHADVTLLDAFTEMAGVDGPFVDSTAIRGVLGDELPWEVDSARGSLWSNGRVQLSVRGLVFPDIPEVPPAQRGINDEATFRVMVSCISEVQGKPNTVNTFTKPFPATRSGNADVDTVIKLPEGGCLAPILFVMSGTENKWFAVAGLEAPED